jgi:glycosyltransferase involved in cell wall biosynthesis
MHNVFFSQIRVSSSIEDALAPKPENSDLFIHQKGVETPLPTELLTLQNKEHKRRVSLRCTSTKSSEKSTLNILHVAEYYFANPDFVRLGRELAKRGHHVSVVTSIRPMDKPEQVKNIRIFEVKPWVTLYKLPHTVSLVPSKIYEIAKQQDIDIMHLLNDLSTNAAFASFTSSLTDIPFVYTIQGPGTKLGHPLVDAIIWAYHQTVERWIVNRAKKVILLSKSLMPTAEELKVEKNRMAVIPSGIDAMYFSSQRPEVKEKAERLKDELNIDGKSVVIGYVGRLTPVKGLGIFFSAVKQIQDKHQNIIILIIGDGALRNSLETIASKLKVKTIFAGWQLDALPYYLLMDIFVLPSFSEGLANVLLEAMSMGKPVVATNVGGNPDIVQNGENGYLVPVGNSKKMALALEQLIENDKLRAQIGITNRQKAEKDFSWTTSVERIEKVYNQAFNPFKT